MKNFTVTRNQVIFVLAVIAICLGIFKFIYTWHSSSVIQTNNYIIESSASVNQTKQVSIVSEAIYSRYMQFLNDNNIKASSQSKLKVKLYKSRKEFKFYNYWTNWAEAYYLYPYSQLYYDYGTPNPYHWFVHEATHQLNNEVAHFKLEKWIEEGISDYFGSSRIENNKINLGKIDTNTYPFWWLNEIMATSGNIEQDKKNNSIIPLTSIITNKNGPDINEYFNLYYLHWWTLTQFLAEYDNGKYRAGLVNMLKEGGNIESFEKNIGKLETIEPLWYSYVSELKKQLKGVSTSAVHIKYEK